MGLSRRKRSRGRVRGVELVSESELWVHAMFMGVCMVIGVFGKG